MTTDLHYRDGGDGRREARASAGRPYQPSGLVLATALLHGAALGAALARPSSLRGTLPWLAMSHLAMSAAGASVGSDLLGPNLLRLPSNAYGPRELCLTFDDGPDPRATPQVLDLLEAGGHRATFFCVGRRVERHPELVREMIRRGHRIENHTYSHPNTFAFRLWGGLMDEVGRAQDSIGEVTGRRPEYFRPPAGMRNPILEAVLARQDLLLVNWSRRAFDAVVRDPSFIVRRLAAGARPGAILLLHDGSLGRRPPPPMGEILPRLLGELARRGLQSVPLPRGLTPADARRGRQDVGCGREN